MDEGNRVMYSEKHVSGNPSAYLVGDTCSCMFISFTMTRQSSPIKTSPHIFSLQILDECILKDGKSVQPELLFAVHRMHIFLLT